MFKKAYKKLHNNQKIAINNVITDIVDNPDIGEQKKGDLTGIYIYKFDCINQEFLLAYEHSTTKIVLLLVGVHENFYRDLKKSI
jgi:mRNA-degrading endonuclease YafQ of YafQ-DinJ toxin-antitoxin module